MVLVLGHQNCRPVQTSRPPRPRRQCSALGTRSLPHAELRAGHAGAQPPPPPVVAPPPLGAARRGSPPLLPLIARQRPPSARPASPTPLPHLRYVFHRRGPYSSPRLRLPRAQARPMRVHLPSSCGTSNPTLGSPGVTCAAAVALPTHDARRRHRRRRPAGGGVVVGRDGLVTRPPRRKSRRVNRAWDWRCRMSWGDAPAWVALVLSAVAVWVSCRARGDGRRSADAAEESARQAVRSADAALRSAAAEEATLAEQRRAAEEQRQAAEEAARPRVQLVIQRVGGNEYRVRNIGGAVAAGVTFERVDNFGALVPGPFDLPPGGSKGFVLFSMDELPLPGELRVTWAGQDTPVPLQVPP